MSDNNIGRVVTPEFRVFFPELLKPKAFKDPKTGRTGEPKYSVTAAFEPGDITELKQKAVAVARAAFPGVELAEIAFPFKSGDKEDARKQGKRPSWKGKVVITFDSPRAPGVIDASGQDIIDAGKLYSGCYGRAEVNFVAYENGLNNNKPSVKAYLNHFIKTRDGERVGAADAKTVFAGVIGKTVNEDPTVGLDDEIPF